jgi:long-subunit fatty acid transport protein
MAQGGPLGADRSVPPTPTPVGAGARAAGMANAFVAIADDASAASWNPAGLVQLERPEFSMVADYLSTRDEFRSSVQPEMDGAHAFDSASLNFLSFVYPLPRPVLGRNVALSLSYQRRYDFNRAFDGRVITAQGAPGGAVLGQDARLEFSQSGGLGALVGTLAFEVTKKLSLGVSLNLWRSSLIGGDGWEQTTRVNSRFTAGSSLSLSRGYSKETYEDIRGESFAIGALWHATSRLSFGLRYDSPLHADADYTSFDRDLRFVPFRAASNIASLRETRELRFPATLSLGAAFRASDRWTVALDISRTDWSDVYAKSGRGAKFSLVDGADLNNPLRRTDFDPVFAVRLGAEHVFLPKQRGETLDYLWSLRGGVFLEQEPASGRNPRRFFAPGDGAPDSFYGATLGVGLLLKQRVNIDMAYQYRFGDNINGDLNPGVAGFRADEDSHRLVVSTVVYF